MVSDVLADAGLEIERYLAEYKTMYSGELLQCIQKCMLEMAAMRTILDTSDQAILESRIHAFLKGNHHDMVKYNVPTTDEIIDFCERSAKKPGDVRIEEVADALLTYFSPFEDGDDLPSFARVELVNRYQTGRSLLYCWAVQQPTGAFNIVSELDETTRMWLERLERD